MELGTQYHCFGALQNIPDHNRSRLEGLSIIRNLLEGVPRLAVNRLKHRMKVVVLKSETSSRCTALVVQHVYRHSHTFEILVWSDVFTCSGPAKSTQMAGTGKLDTLVVVVWEHRHSGLLQSYGKWCSHESACGQTASPVSPNMKISSVS